MLIVPKVSQMMFFHLKTDEVEDSLMEFKSRVADENEDSLFIEFPIETVTGKVKRLHVGDILSAHFITTTGVKHFFETHVTNVILGEFPLVELARPSQDNMTSIQRRNFFRVMTEVDIAVRDEKGQQLIFKTDDISGGGISFIIDRHIHFEAAEKLNCWVLLPHRNGTIEHSNFIGEVLRLKELETGRKIVMMKFDEIVETERQRIIRFLFEKQIELRER
ncbi:MAG TPA: PilZ domain-containing protein [Candidatus Paenibacillus intestinavium]|nr:PilZ domain-containing protein [Candidatus Paenibacillus intestinavium]